MTRVTAWLFSPKPRGRVAALRVIVYGFVFVDLLWLRPWVWTHGELPQDMYHPLFVGRLIPLPTPTPLLVRVSGILLLAFAALALSGRLPRAAGAGTAVLYLWWMIIAFSYGKVDHDRFAFLVALAVLPTVGPARIGDGDGDERSGWAIHMIQIAVVITYLFAAFTKFRFGGGLDWLNGAVLARAILRRGSSMADPLLDLPGALTLGQYMIMAFELASPLLLLEAKRIGRIYLGVAVAFHVVVFASLGIMFWPHFVTLSVFLPLERLKAGSMRIRPPSSLRRSVSSSR